MEYKLVHDAAKVRFPWGTILFTAFLLAASVVLLVRSIQQEQGEDDMSRFFFLVFVFFVFCLGVRNTRDAVNKYLQCKDWAQSNDYSVVEGVVTDLDPMPEGGRHKERFTVNKVQFEYPSRFPGGFNKIAMFGGPIRNGLQVRIAHHEGRILRLEIQK